MKLKQFKKGVRFTLTNGDPREVVGEKRTYRTIDPRNGFTKTGDYKTLKALFAACPQYTEAKVAN